MRCREKCGVGAECERVLGWGKGVLGCGKGVERVLGVGGWERGCGGLG